MENCPKDCKKEKAGDYKKKTMQKLKKDIKVAIAVLCPDLDSLQQAIMFHILKGVAKKDCKKSCGPCKEEIPKCAKDECCLLEAGKERVKGFLLSPCKDEVMKMMEVALESFKKAKGKPLPSGEGIWACKVAKAIANLMWKMHKKGFGLKENWERIAGKFWSKRMHCRMKKMKGKAKKFAKKIVYFAVNEGDDLYKKVATKSLTRAFIKFFHMKWKACRGKMHEEKKEKEGLKRKGEGKCPKGKGKPMGKFFKEKMLREGTSFALDYLKTNEEIIKSGIGAVKGIIEAYVQENKCCPKPSEKIIAKVVIEAICAAGEEKKPSEFFVDFANRYLRGFVCCCDKKCIKNCRKLAETCLMFSGAKSRCTIEVAMRWGALMCCQANCKVGCPKEVCAEYLSKWIKDYVPIVEEALKIMKELSCKEECGDKMQCVMRRRVVLKYLKLNCVEGKFDAENYKNFLGKIKKCMEKACEKLGQKDCPTKCCDKTKKPE